MGQINVKEEVVKKDKMPSIKVTLGEALVE